MSSSSGATDVAPGLRRAGLTAWFSLGVLALVAALAALAAQLLIVVVPLVLAVVLATLAVPASRRLARLGLPDGLAAFTVVVGGALVLALTLAALVPPFLAEAQELGPVVAEGWRELVRWLDEGPLAVDAEHLNRWLTEGINAVEARAGTIATSALLLATSATELFAAAAFTIVLTFYLVKDGPAIAAWLISRAPTSRSDTLSACGLRAWETLGAFVRGVTLVAAVDATIVGLGLFALGVPLVLPLAVVVFFGAFVPVIGSLLAGLLAVLVALAAQGPAVAAIVIVLLVVVSQLESHVLWPVIMGKALPLHPVVVLVALAAGAKLLGLVGAVLAIPVATVVSVIGNELRLRRLDPEAARAAGARPLGGAAGGHSTSL